MKIKGKRWPVALAVLTVVSTALTAAGRSGRATADAAGVSIKSFAFNPTAVTVNAGDTIRWSNDETMVPHTVTADDGSFDSGRLMPGSGFSQSFGRAGTIAYHCSIHPAMHGTIVVNAPAPAPGSNPQATSAPPAAAPGTARTVTFMAGIQLIGVPTGTTVDAGAIFGYDAQAGAYTQVQPGDTLQGGSGYWATFDDTATVQLATGSEAPMTINAGAGAWQLIGNPSATQAALVTGADAVYAFNATTGQYVSTTSLAPGRGAWAISLAGGSITIAPGASAATPSPTPAPTAQPTSQPAPAVQPAMQPTPYHAPTTMPGPYHPYGY